MDFVSEALTSGRRIKVLAIDYDFNKEDVDLAYDFGISGQYVTRVLDQAARFRGYPRPYERSKDRNLRAKHWINGGTRTSFNSN